jgi:hydroxybutyrate-dimer hydrolase
VLELTRNPRLIDQARRDVDRRSATTALRLLHDRESLPAVRGAVAAATARPAPRSCRSRSRPNRCTALKAKGLLTTSSTRGTGEESLDKLLARMAAGSNILHASHYSLRNAAVVRPTPIATGASASPTTCAVILCRDRRGEQATAHRSGALATDLRHLQRRRSERRVNIVNNLSPGGPLRDPASNRRRPARSTSTPTARICQRNLWVGTDANAARVKAGVCRNAAHRNLHGKPAIIVAGRRTRSFRSIQCTRARITVRTSSSKGARASSSTSRSKRAALRRVHRQRRAAGIRLELRPLHYYFIQAMDRMWAYLTVGTPLPPSQLVRTTPRGGPLGRTADHRRQTCPRSRAHPRSPIRSRSAETP